MGHLDLNTKKLRLRIEADDEKYTYEEILKEAVKLLRKELKETVE